MNFTPLGRKIFVEDVVEKYAGILEIPSTCKEKPTFRSKIVAMGHAINDPTVAGCVMSPLAVGDTILRGEFIGQIVEEKKDDLGRIIYRSRVMSVEDVLGKLE